VGINTIIHLFYGVNSEEKTIFTNVKLHIS